VTYVGNCRLGDLFESRRERGRPGLPLLSVTMNDGLVGRDDLDRKQDSALTPEEHLLVKPGDIAYNMMRMWQGAYGLADREGLVSPAYVVLKPKSNVAPAYLAQLLRTPRMLYLMWAYSYGLTDDRLRLYFDDFASIPVTVPSLESQRRVATKVAMWDRAIDVLSRLAANARLEKRALLKRLLPTPTELASAGEPSSSWRLIRLGDVVDLNPKRPEKPEDGRVSFLPMESVSEHGIVDASRDRGYEEVCTGHPGFKDGDLVVAKITPCFENGKGALLAGLINGVGFGSTEFHVLRSKGIVESRLLAQVLQSREFRSRGAAEMEGSAGQKRISADFIRSFRFLCPTSRSQQLEICDLLDAADRISQVFDAARDTVALEKRALAQRVLAQQAFEQGT
jgi:type I restriction enzyme, S subunit